MDSDQLRRFIRRVPVGDGNTGIMDEQVLILVFRSINWDPRALSVAARVSRRLRAVASRVLWRELCLSRAPRMITALLARGGGGGRVPGGWHAMAKLLFFCCGHAATAAAAAAAAAATTSVPVTGVSVLVSKHKRHQDRNSNSNMDVVQIDIHSVRMTRFSKTSGRSFLTRQCSEDLLYVSDPCEHVVGGSEGDVGVYRGVFGGFVRSKTMAGLVGRQVELELLVRCPYCGAKVWDMAAAGLVPRSAARWLGSEDGRVEYFVCVSGHLHGSCWLEHLTTDEEDDDRSST